MAGKVQYDHRCICGKHFKHSRKKKIYCSNKCAHKFKPSRTWNETQRDSKYKINYGITLEDYNLMFEKQKGCCAICGSHQMEFSKHLHVDHCHTTGEVRGLLCQKCNRGLGLFNDNPILLKAAQEYVL